MHTADCPRCSTGSFPNPRARQQHIENSSFHFWCCGNDFESRDARRDHWVQSSEHHFCQDCDTLMDDDEELRDHRETIHFCCLICGKTFRSEHSREQHYRQAADHFYCVECKRPFKSENNLRAHLNSSQHQERKHKCLFDDCDQAFVSRSALILHLMEGGCRSGANRAFVNEVVKKFDKQHIISIPPSLITSTDSAALYAPLEGGGFKCSLCPKICQTPAAMQQHLASPRHRANIYICADEDCNKRFTTLGAFFQHFESESCEVSSLSRVKRSLNGVMRRLKRELPTLVDSDG